MTDKNTFVHNDIKGFDGYVNFDQLNEGEYGRV